MRPPTTATGPSPGSEIRPPASEDSRTQAAHIEGFARPQTLGVVTTSTARPTADPDASAAVPGERQESVDTDARTPLGASTGSTVMKDELRLEEEKEEEEEVEGRSPRHPTLVPSRCAVSFSLHPLHLLVIVCLIV